MASPAKHVEFFVHYTKKKKSVKVIPVFLFKSGNMKNILRLLLDKGDKAYFDRYTLRYPPYTHLHL